MCYLRFIRENDEHSAAPAVDSVHRGYNKIVSDFKNSLIYLAIRAFHEVDCHKLKADSPMTNLDYHYSGFGPTIGGTCRGILDQRQVSKSHFLHCPYILQVVKFGPEIEYTIFKTFIAHSLIIESRQNYQVKALFGNY